MHDVSSFGAIRRGRLCINTTRLARATSPRHASPAPRPVGQVQDGGRERDVGHGRHGGPNVGDGRNGPRRDPGTDSGGARMDSEEWTRCMDGWVSG